MRSLRFGPEPASGTSYGVSYAWTDASKAEVDKLCQAAEARGIRNAKLNDAASMQCVRVYRLPDAQIFSPLARSKVAIYWKEQFAELDAVVKAHGADILGENDLRNYKRMQVFAHHVSDILYVMADTLQAKDFDELLQHGLA